MNSQIGNVQLMQKINRLKVLSCIRNNPFIVRPAVAEQTGLSLSSITNIVSFLIDKGLVTETGFEAAERTGRKAVLLRFCSDAYYLVCVGISQSGISLFLTDLDGKRISTVTRDFPGDGAVRTLDSVKEGIQELLSGCEDSKILGIGIAVSAFVLPDGTVAVATKLRWDRTDLKTDLEKSFGKPVFITDTSVARAHFCCEHNCGSRSMLLIDLVDGVGAVHFYEGHLNRSVIGEIGHTTVSKDGDECFCGNRGCLEIMCSLERVVEQYRKAGKGSTFDDVLNGSRSGDKTAEHLLSETAEYLGIGMANAVNVLSPDTVIINAGQYLSCPELLQHAVDEAKRRVFSALLDTVSYSIVSIDDAQMTQGMAQSICDGIFDIDFHLGIFE